MSIGASIAAGSAIAGLKGGTDLGTSLLMGALNRKWSKKSASADAKRQLWNQQRYDRWYTNNIYPQIQNLDYTMAQRYAENSAKWEVQGLKNAGLNPLLAVSNGLSGAGVDYSAPSASAGSVGSGSSQQSSVDTPSGPDFAEAIRDVASADQMQTDAEIKSDTKSSVVSSAQQAARLAEKNVEIADATKDKILAEANQIKANTAKTELENQSGGYSNYTIKFGKFQIPLPLADVVRTFSKLNGAVHRNVSTAKQNKPSEREPEVFEINTGKAPSDAEKELQRRLEEINRDRIRKSWPSRHGAY